MSIYKKVTDREGIDQYHKIDVDTETNAGKTTIVERTEVPEDVLAELDANKEAVDDGHTTPVARNTCIFCGVAAKLTRLLNGQTIYLCDEDYYSKNLGQIAQQVREVSDAKVEAKG